MMKKFYVFVVVGAVLAAAMVGASAGAEAAKSGPRLAVAAPPASQLAALKRQVAKLTAEVKRLRAANAALSAAGIASALARAKAANDRFQSVEQAKAAGYIQRSPCESSPEGGMGFHFVNDDAMRDPKLDPAKPEILTYAPGPGGVMQLVGAEYWKPDADQNLTTDSDRPSLFGRAFDGPMEGHNPPGTLPGTGMPRHYDLHVWFWKRNPSGLFAIWNPDVSCK
jgi:hypothetical protein